VVYGVSVFGPPSLSPSLCNPPLLNLLPPPPPLSLPGVRIIAAVVLLNGVVVVWGMPSNCPAVQEYSGHTSAVKSLRVVPYSFSLDGEERGANSTFISGASDGKMVLWDLSSSNQLKQYSISGYLHCLEVLPDSSFLAGTDDFKIRLYKFAVATAFKAFSGHSRDVTCLRSLGDGTFISGSWDKSIMRWNVQSGVRMMTYTGHTEAVNTLEVMQDGTFISGSDDGKVKRWSVTSPSAIETYTVGDYVYALAVVDDRTFLSAGFDRMIKGFKIGTLNPVFLNSQALFFPIRCLLFADNFIISSGDDGFSYRWELGRKDPLTKFTHGGSILSSSLIGDGTYVTGAYDKVIKRFRLEGKESINRCCMPLWLVSSS
jgi:WD40 repeat protein